MAALHQVSMKRNFSQAIDPATETQVASKPLKTKSTKKRKQLVLNWRLRIEPFVGIAKSSGVSSGPFGNMVKI